MTCGRERRCNFCYRKFDYDDLQQEWVCSECNEANIPTLRAEVARLTEERDRMREALEWLETRLEDYLREEWLNPIISEMKVRVTSILESTNGTDPDESEVSDDPQMPTQTKSMTQREWDLRHANPYDLSDPHQPKM